MFSIFRPTRVAKWIVLPWVQWHAWILAIAEAYHQCGQAELLIDVKFPFRDDLDISSTFKKLHNLLAFSG
jgi:hypothetical protein